MDPATLATLAVGALVRYLSGKAARLAGRAGHDVDQTVDRGLDRLYDAVRGRLAGDAPANLMLERLEADPSDQRQQGRFEYALESLLSADPDFARSLAGLLESVSDARSPGVTIRDAGPVSLGGNVNQSGRYVAGRDLTVGRDEPPR
jgi:hypothetical protein